MLIKRLHVGQQTSLGGSQHRAWLLAHRRRCPDAMTRRESDDKSDSLLGVPTCEGLSLYYVHLRMEGVDGGGEAMDGKYR